MPANQSCSSRARLFAFLRVFLILLFWLAQRNTAAAQTVPAPVPASVPFSAAGIGTGTREIDGLWQFRVGDDPDGKLGWAQPGFDDSKWERIPVDGSYVDPGHPDDTGFAWYRRQISLDPADKTRLALLLDYGSVAEVYWNGVKIGGLGAPPPNLLLPWQPAPLVIPLPSLPGAASGTLVIRLFSPPPFGRGLHPAPQLGYAPLIQQISERWVEHALHKQAVSYMVWVILLCAGLTALVLWLRSRSQWILFCAGTFFVSFAIEYFISWFISSASTLIVQPFFDFFDWLNHTAFLFLILLLAGLPNRPGIRGFRFWKRVCLAASALVLLGAIREVWQFFLYGQPPSALSHFLDAISDLRDYAEGLSLLLVLVACLVLSKPRLPRLLFMAAAALSVFLGDLDGLFMRIPGLGPLELLRGSFFQIYGSNMTYMVAADLLLLLATIYAVWDQLSGQLAEQRRVIAEMKAAHEVQEILVPAASAEDAPGYAVASVYRPASEVGGDFFQIIPLPDQSTLIVAGDVSGKGLRAAMTVSLIVGAVRTLAEQDPSPASVLAGLNRRLIGRTQGGFATCCAIRVNPSGHAVISNAGHCQPYIDGQEIELPNGIPLGIVDGITYEETALTLPQGAQMVLLSDGVPEARNEKGELFGFDRTAAISMQSAESIAHTAVAFGQDDDITVLTLVRLATA